jgi:hypothetical protein
MMPQGFPVMHARFWVNSVLPPLAAAMCLLGIIAAVRKWDAVLKCLVLVGGAVMVSAGVAGKFCFPQSVSGLLFIAVAIGVVIALMSGGLSLWVLRKKSVPRWVTVLCLGVGILLGVFLPWSQRAMESATKPCGSDVLTPSLTLPGDVGDLLPLSDRVAVSPGDGRVRVALDEATLDVYPLLSFRSRSPDRCWTLFAPRSTNVLPRRSLLGMSRGTGDVILEYKDDGFSRLEVAGDDAEGVASIEAKSYLPYAVYSHLNSFCELYFSGSGSLGLSFSPCSEIVEMKPSDYPVGRPVRLAYLDAEGVFHVVEAHSGEKGPFRELARGVLKRDEPLEMTVYVDKKAVCRITFDDWARQAGRQLSPTAGWGLPENAIEFSSRRDGETNRGVIFMTLAGTSIGRGWDSVGHAPGTYRNAIRVEPLP